MDGTRQKLLSPWKRIYLRMREVEAELSALSRSGNRARIEALKLELTRLDQESRAVVVLTAAVRKGNSGRPPFAS